MEAYSADAARDAPAVIVLHGSGGPRAAAVSHNLQWKALAESGYRVYVPHYLDATDGSAVNPAGHYDVWVQTIADAIRFIETGHRKPPDGIALIGYSLGASVALAAASQGCPPQRLVAWSGSLPDEYFQAFKAMPPTLIVHGERDRVIPVWNVTQFERLCRMRGLECEMKLYPREGHDFSLSATAGASRQIEIFLKRFLPVHLRNAAISALPITRQPGGPGVNDKVMVATWPPLVGGRLRAARPDAALAGPSDARETGIEWPLNST